MKTIALKTNITCAACVAKVTRSLNETAGEGNWKIDLQNPDKILHISADKVNEIDIVQAIKAAGYRAEAILQ